MAFDSVDILMLSVSMFSHAFLKPYSWNTIYKYLIKNTLSRVWTTFDLITPVNKYSLLFGSFYDIVVGIEDPGVFFPPPFCDKASDRGETVTDFIDTLVKTWSYNLGYAADNFAPPLNVLWHVLEHMLAKQEIIGCHSVPFVWNSTEWNKDFSHVTHFI